MTGWWDRAACKDADPALFHPEQGGRGSYTVARTYCDRCPVLAACLADCLAWEEKQAARSGMWGGMTPEERWEFVGRCGPAKPTWRQKRKAVTV